MLYRHGGSMSEADVNSRPIDIVRDLYGAFGRRDLDAVLQRCAPDVVVTQDSRLPWGGRYTGHDGLADFTVKLVGAIDSTVTPEGLFEAGDHVVQHGRTRGVVRHNGAPFDVAECHLWTIHRGLVTEAAFFIDSDAMLAALNA
jgi:uncharacterized protein